MRLTIDHRTRYRFSEPQARLVQLLRLTPPSTHDQNVASWRIDVDCDAKLRPHRDGYGNLTTLLYVDGPLDAIEIAVYGEVLTSHANGVVRDVAEPLPLGLFQRSTPLTARHDALAAFAREVTLGAGSTLGALHRLNETLSERFTIDRERPEPGLSAGDAFAREKATPRDLAHMFVSAARGLGAPARYVSGYVLEEGEHRAAPHGWAEAHVEGIGWIGFDPCAGVSPEDRYVRAAVGLDAAAAAPVAGSRLGEGDEALEVDVSVHRED